MHPTIPGALITRLQPLYHSRFTPSSFVFTGQRSHWPRWIGRSSLSYETLLHNTLVIGLSNILKESYRDFYRLFLW